MVEVTRGGRPEEIRFGAKHKLFVEGSGEDALDPLVLHTLLGGTVTIQPLGSSLHVQSVAEALYEHRPYWYFVIDRDHYDDVFVEQCWSTFPDPNKKNLLVWRRRELENYFLIPEYLERSRYLTVSPQNLRDRILEACRERLYLDAANQVIVGIREDLKAQWIATFTGPAEFRSKEDALEKLLGCAEFASQSAKASRVLGPESITERLENTLDEFTGGSDPLEYGTGKWLERIRGKKVLGTVIQTCFDVRDAEGRRVQGKRALTEVAKHLAGLSLNEQPQDFRQLHGLIHDRIAAT